VDSGSKGSYFASMRRRLPASCANPRAPPNLNMSLAPGDVIENKYEIVRLLGEGGMGAVFEGRNRLIERRVAIKVLHAEARAAAGVVERFEREARAAGMIGGDHILEVLDLGSLPGGERYMVMEFLDGETLSSRISRRGRLTTAELVPLLRQALVGLRGAHAAGIVHRDLKPDNLFILREKAGHKDFLKIIDFGVSKFSGLSSEFRMTKTGSVMGTPYYMSPEQAKGASGVDHQSDIYSLGVIAFEALTGQVPFEGTSFNDLMFKIVLSEMPDVQKLVPDVDPRFAAIIRRAMAKDVAHRYPTADAFIADLDAFSGAAGALGKSWSESARSSVAGAPSVGGRPVAGHGSPAPSGAGVRTHAEWSQTSGDVPPATKKKNRGALYGALGAVVLVALGAVYVMASGPGGAPPALVPAGPESALVPTTASSGAPRAGEAVVAPAVEVAAPGATSPAPSETEAKDGEEAQPHPAANTSRTSTRPSMARAVNRQSSKSPPEAVPPAPQPAPAVAPKAPEPASEPAPAPPPRREVAAPVRTPDKPIKKPATPSRDFGY
jgi:eukaryotic-like serine/threonine-protein kinase